MPKAASLRTTALLPVTTALKLVLPAIQPTPTTVSPVPGATFDVVWRVENRSNALRMLDVVPAADADVELVSPATEWYAPAYADANITLRYRVKNPSLYQTVSSLSTTARDRDSTQYAVSGTVDVETALQLAAPTVGAPVPGSYSEVQGARFTVVFPVTNNSNTSRMLRVSPVATGSLEVVSGGGDVRLDGYGSGTVSVTYQVRTGAAAVPYTTATPVVQVVDRDSPVFVGSGSFQFTVRNRPPVAALAVTWATPVMAQAGMPVTFDTQGTTDPDSDSPLTCVVEFGDGQTGVVLCGGLWR